MPHKRVFLKGVTSKEKFLISFEFLRTIVSLQQSEFASVKMYLKQNVHGFVFQQII